MGANSAQAEQDADRHTLRILVASDLHLGYGESDPVRRHDSFNTFDEVFQLANRHNADMVLLAGDIFHDNKPSRRAMQRALEVMRDHCLGDREVHIEVVSDPSTNFHDKYRTVNYEDPNYNVQLPVFAIHGNHDDPAGDGGLAPLDLLSSANLVNYFGRAQDFENIVLAPILMQKGETKLALYGLGHVRDERLSRCFDRKSVKVSRPTGNDGEWFNVMAVHQNRHVRGVGGIQGVKKGYIRESQLPSCMDLIIWGHEHECQIGSGMNAVTESTENQFVVLQPGSTVATSLVEGEAKPKHVALLQIHKEKWKLDALPLKTVRPFAVRDVCLEAVADAEDVDLSSEEAMMAFLEEQVNEVIADLAERAQAQAASNSGADDVPGMLPLVRLRVDYTGFSTCNPQRFGQRFVNRVANPGDILLFQRKTKKHTPKQTVDAPDAADEQPTDREDAACQIQHILTEFLQGGKEQLRLLSQQELNAAVFEHYVGRDTKSAIADSIKEMLSKTQTYLARQSYGSVDRSQKEAAIEEMLSKRHETSTTVAASAGSGSASGTGAGRGADSTAGPTGAGASRRGAAGAASGRGAASSGPRCRAGGGGDNDDNDNDDDGLFDSDDDQPEPTASRRAPAASRGRGRGRASGQRASGTRGRAAGGAAAGGGSRQTQLPTVGGTRPNSGVVDLDEEDEVPARGAKRPRATASSATAGRQAKASRAGSRRRHDDDDDDDYVDDEEDADASTAAPSSRAHSFANPRRRYK